jgi:hypothetical protein
VTRASSLHPAIRLLEQAPRLARPVLPSKRILSSPLCPPSTHTRPPHCGSHLGASAPAAPAARAAPTPGCVRTHTHPTPHLRPRLPANCSQAAGRGAGRGAGARTGTAPREGPCAPCRTRPFAAFAKPHTHVRGRWPRHVSEPTHASRGAGLLQTLRLGICSGRPPLHPGWQSGAPRAILPPPVLCLLPGGRPPSALPAAPSHAAAPPVRALAAVATAAATRWPRLYHHPRCPFRLGRRRLAPSRAGTPPPGALPLPPPLTLRAAPRPPLPPVSLINMPGRGFPLQGRLWPRPACNVGSLHPGCRLRARPPGPTSQGLLMCCILPGGRGAGIHARARRRPPPRKCPEALRGLTSLLAAFRQWRVQPPRAPRLQTVFVPPPRRAHAHWGGCRRRDLIPSAWHPFYITQRPLGGTREKQAAPRTPREPPARGRHSPNPFNQPFSKPVVGHLRPAGESLRTFPPPLFQGPEKGPCLPLLPKLSPAIPDIPSRPACPAERPFPVSCAT